VPNTAVVPAAIGESDVGLPANWRIGPSTVAVANPLNLQLAFTPSGRGLRLFSPAQLHGVPPPGGDLLLCWLRCTRASSGDSWVLGDVPLGELTEAYDLETLNGAAAVAAVGWTSLLGPLVAAIIALWHPGLSEACGGEVGASSVAGGLALSQGVVNFVAGYVVRERR